MSGPGRGRTVLVVNDDGPAADGLVALVRAVAADERNDIVVAVPAEDVSSTGTALGAVWAGGIDVVPYEKDWPDAAGARSYAVSAYPAAIVTVAMMGAFGARPDLVVAGINHGSNVGRGLIHSSTVGAALTAATHGVPGVAFSAQHPTVDWTRWPSVVAAIIDESTRDWPEGGALNVNFPACPSAGPVDLAWCCVADADTDATMRRVGSAAGPHSVHMSYGPPARAPDADTDVGALGQGRVALSWLTLPYGRRPR